MMMGSAPYSMLGMRDGFLGVVNGPSLLDTAMQGDMNVETEATDERVKVWAALWAAGEQVDEMVEGGGGGGQAIKRIKRLRAEQVRALEASFAKEAKLEPERKVELAEQLGLQPRQVAVWFQNRRARSKSKQLELDYATLSSHYHSLLAETHRLKSQVAQLTSELEHAKRGTSQKEGEPSTACNLAEALNAGDAGVEAENLDGLTNIDAVEEEEEEAKMSKSVNDDVEQQSSSCCCSDYSVILDSENSNSVNRRTEASAYECNINAEFSHNWGKDNLLPPTHQGLAYYIATTTTMQSHDHLLLEEPPFTTNVNHVASDWLWGLTT